jgi:hypothetical protein
VGEEVLARIKDMVEAPMWTSMLIQNTKTRTRTVRTPGHYHWSTKKRGFGDGRDGCSAKRRLGFGQETGNLLVITNSNMVVDNAIPDDAEGDEKTGEGREK